VKNGSELDAFDLILVPAMARARHDRETGQLPHRGVRPADRDHPRRPGPGRRRGATPRGRKRSGPSRTRA
jgi:hypothetical protein